MGDGTRKGSKKSNALKREFDEVKHADGSITYKPKQMPLTNLGKPPWTLDMPDNELVPQELTDFVGVITWRGRRYVLEPSRDWDDVEVN